MQYARDNLDLDPGWHTCKGCDGDGDFTPDADGLCPECAARKNMSERIWAHYDHAKEKHPHFCDIIKNDCLPFDFARWHLEDCRERLLCAREANIVRWDELLDCEKYEAMEEIDHGNTAHAVEELYDCIAVLLRTIDVLEGRQKLREPTKEEAK